MMPEGFKSRVNTDVTRQAPRDPAALRSGLAEGAQALGVGLGRAADQDAQVQERVADSENRIAIRKKRRWQSSVIADGYGRFADVQSDIAEGLDALDQESAPGAPDYEAKADALITEKLNAYLDTLPEDADVRQRLEPMVARFGAKIRQDARTWALGKKNEHEGNSIQAGVDAAGNRLYHDPTDQGLTDALADMETAVDGLDVDGTTKESLKQNFTKSLTIRAWRGELDANPQGALDALDNGMLDGVAEHQEIVSLRASAQSAVDRQQAVVARAQRAQAQQVTDLARARIEDVHAGVDVDPQELAGYRAQAVAAGDTALVHDLDVAIGASRATAYLQGASLARLDKAKREIEGNAGWRRDPTQVATHDRIEGMAATTRRAAEDDPLALYGANGGPALPDFDLRDGKVMARYFQAGDAAAERYGGNPHYIPKLQADAIKKEFDTGSAGDRANIIAGFARYGPARAKAMLRQVVPAKSRYVVLANLATMRNRSAGMGLVGEALDGWEQAKANSELFDAGAAQSEVDDDYGEAIALVDGQTRAGVMQVARGIYAARAAQDNITRFDRDLWSESYRAAWGAAGDGTGGVGEARDGSAMLLPKGLTQNDFDRILARSDGATIMAAAGHDAPMWSGQTMSAAEFKKLIPVMVADGLYMFRSDSGYAKSQRHPGENFRLDIRALGRETRGRADPPPSSEDRIFQPRGPVPH